MNYTIESKEGLKLVVSDFGAEMQSMTYGGIEYLWQGDPKYWTKHAPVLFPYVGRLYQGKYKIGDHEYELGCHGFASKVSFEAEQTASDVLTFTLRDNEETLAQYPFHFQFQVIYKVTGQTVSITYRVSNTAGTGASGANDPAQAIESLTNGTLYFAVGGHPAFNVPLKADIPFDHYYLMFKEKASPDQVITDDSVLITGEQRRFLLEDERALNLHHDIFDNDAITLTHVCDTVTLQTDDDSRAVTVHFPQLPYFGIWHKNKSDAPYVCIEPWTCLPGREGVIEDLRYRNDMIRLPKGGSWETEWTISVR